MKAKVKLALPGFAGNMDDMVIYYNSRLNCLIARKKVMPRRVPPNTTFCDIHAFIKRIAVSDAYKEDCRRYISLYNQQNRRRGRALNSWLNVLMRILMRLKTDYPDIDYTVLTRDQIIAESIPCLTLARAIDAGLLEKVPGYLEMQSQI
ncbi:MAG: hypothetical protein CVU48_02625 [Candidatus Cloacimonetes bacterium HGW-Cloacimonetes-1]|nr:MAG: hypothetical protein CVU48_02625 [Candidatus Cloacimonetes bacterium HGW-Cloacimonetes-1]